MELGLVGFQERGVLRRLDAIPRIAGDDPAIRRVALERIEILRLAGQQAHHFAPLEQAAGIPFTHELREVGAEQHVEDRIRLGIGQRLYHAARIDLAQRCRLVGHEFHVRLRRLQQFLEGRDRRLAVFIVRIHQRPALFVQLDCFRHQHRDLHVGRRTQAEGVTIAVFPDDLVGQRFGGQEEDLALLGEVRHRQAHVGQEGAGQRDHPLARHQFLRRTHRVARIGLVVARNDFQLLAVDTAAGIDFVHRKLDAVGVRHEEGRERLVAVQFTDLDDIRRVGGGNAGSQERGGRGEKPDALFHALVHAFFHLYLLPIGLMNARFVRHAVWEAIVSASRLRLLFRGTAARPRGVMAGRCR